MARYPEQGGVHTQDNFFSRVSASDDGRFIVGLSASNRISVWERHTCRLVLHVQNNNFNALTAAALSADGCHLAYAEWNGRISFYRRTLVGAGFDVCDIPLWWGRSHDNVRIP